MAKGDHRKKETRTVILSTLNRVQNQELFTVISTKMELQERNQTLKLALKKVSITRMEVCERNLAQSQNKHKKLSRLPVY